MNVPEVDVGSPIIPTTDAVPPTIDPVNGTTGGPPAPNIEFPIVEPIEPMVPIVGGFIGRVIAKPVCVFKPRLNNYI